MNATAVSAEWRDLLRLLPGYDPFAQADGCWFDPDAAKLALDFIAECVTHVEGALAGRPFELEPWQRSFVANLMGWKRTDELGRPVRRYKEALLYVPRKNGKTPLAAALALYVFFCDGEAGQQDYVAAANREQANMLFRQCKGMIQNDRRLSKRCRVYGGNGMGGHSRSIVKPADNSFLHVISADADSKHGGNSHLVVIDELHAQPSRDLVDTLTTSTASLNRKQNLTIYITTADFNRPSICNEKHALACAVRDNRGDRAAPGFAPHFLPCVYEALPTDDWKSPETWKKANPNLGVSVSLEYLERECKKAQDTPAYENTYRRLHLNQKTETDTRAIPMDRWDAAPGPAPLVTDAETFRAHEERLAGRSCFGGLDLSTTTDISACPFVFPDGQGGYDVLPYFWVPREGARRRELRDRVPYETWARLGLVRFTEGDVIDYDVIRADLNLLRERFHVREIAADRWNATQLITQLQGDGFEVVAYGQGYKDMTAPTKELIKLVVEGKLRHHGHLVLRWMAANTATEQDAAGNLKPSKKKSTERIDGIVGVIMALGRALLAGGGDGPTLTFW